MTRRRWAGWVFVMIGFALLGVGMAVVLDGVRQADEEIAQVRAESAERQTVIEVLAADVEALRQQVSATGEVPVAPEPAQRVEDRDVEIVTGPPGPGPTVEQIRSAVSSVLASNPGLTQPQIVAAATAYLQSNPPPPGRAGADGDDGEPGATGPAGRAPTDAEIAARVAEYCATGACVGPAGRDGKDGAPGRDGASGPRGEPGEPGEPGRPGRGIVDVFCEGTALVITFDQPPLEDVIEDVCRDDPEPEPTPDPTLDPTGAP